MTSDLCSLKRCSEKLGPGPELFMWCESVSSASLGFIRRFSLRAIEQFVNRAVLIVLFFLSFLFFLLICFQRGGKERVKKAGGFLHFVWFRLSCEPCLRMYAGQNESCCFDFEFFISCSSLSFI